MRRRRGRGPLAGAGGWEFRAGAEASLSLRKARLGLRKAIFPPTPCGTGLEGLAPGESGGRACHASAFRRERKRAREAVCDAAGAPEAGTLRELGQPHGKAAGGRCAAFPLRGAKEAVQACGYGESVPHGFCPRGREAGACSERVCRRDRLAQERFLLFRPPRGGEGAALPGADRPGGTPSTSLLALEGTAADGSEAGSVPRVAAGRGCPKASACP